MILNINFTHRGQFNKRQYDLRVEVLFEIWSLMTIIYLSSKFGAANDDIFKYYTHLKNVLRFNKALYPCNLCKLVP